ncbi:MAG: hypothetical protein A3I44_01750 [Candidatus Sungbacteria bacterium RIFCSPLOWO2_02_FULL_51_17]|uniref:Uncharacterized protein n=1 Tax=Candidatus Sungbacteria bacterium RIFCSPHIGHO2_02_FULL_51_29 TaxID=1802273 RepID=A0A1G2KV65_9BACT|nr:MAG: hypothetical protein A3C16_01490 [Candidatus Sungbacteria bacterium RIFCSPHIGHO2_02_FULL_51_29]OHA10900.1 MAG: hypothetical protein A3I44_01750 [Candidatus Sungbacteria bacterium RIFCSPLOWO2_02_FULL_51_17]
MGCSDADAFSRDWLWTSYDKKPEFEFNKGTGAWRKVERSGARVRTPSGTGAPKVPMPRTPKKGPEKGPSQRKKITELPRADFSADAIRRAVRGSTIQHPLTVWPPMLGILGGGAVMLFLASPPLALALGIGGVAIGAGTWALNRFLRGDLYAARYLKQMREALAERREAMLANLQSALEECRTVRGGEAFADQATEQFPRLKEKFETFVAILNDKFSEGELTHGRFLAAAEQLYLASLDNLRDIAMMLENIRAIDNDGYIESRLTELAKDPAPSQTDVEEIQTLTERKELRRKELERVDELLTFNERSMTQIDKVATALVKTKTMKGEASVDMETALKELAELAERAPSYARTE